MNRENIIEALKKSGGKNIHDSILNDFATAILALNQPPQLEGLREEFEKEFEEVRYNEYPTIDATRADIFNWFAQRITLSESMEPDGYIVGIHFCKTIEEAFGMGKSIVPAPVYFSPVASRMAQGAGMRNEDQVRSQTILDCQELLLKQMFLMTHENGYPSKAVPHATILSLPALMKTPPVEQEQPADIREQVFETHGVDPNATIVLNPVAKQERVVTDEVKNLRKAVFTANTERDRLGMLLEEKENQESLAIDLVGSALQIAIRRGKDTNWEAFENRCKEALIPTPAPELKWLRSQQAAKSVEDKRKLLYLFRDLYCQNVDIATIDEFINGLSAAPSQTEQEEGK